MLERQRFASEGNTLPTDRRLNDQSAIRESHPLPTLTPVVTPAARNQSDQPGQ